MAILARSLRRRKGSGESSALRSRHLHTGKQLSPLDASFRDSVIRRNVQRLHPLRPHHRGAAVVLTGHSSLFEPAAVCFSKFGSSSALPEHLVPLVKVRLLRGEEVVQNQEARDYACAGFSEESSVLLFHAPNEVCKLPEKIRRVVRAGRGLGVVLHAENRQRLVRQPLDS